MCKTYRDFPDFYKNPVIQSIANNERWTVSDSNKTPIDMFCLEYQNRICGALFTDENSLTSLPHLCELLPDAANHAYYMDALIDKFVMLDIEPKCPDNIKQKLLQLPYTYGEVSMSGKGYHLIFPLPDCIDYYPIVKTKVVLKEEHGWYEILLNHYVTFTRNMLPPATGHENFIELFKELASTQKESHREDVDIQNIQPEHIPNQDKIIELLINQTYKKTAKDFYDDMSKYEYGHIGFLNYKLNCILNVSAIKAAHEYSDNEKAWLLYQAAKEVIPYRPKHDETRDDLPWLLYLSQEIIAKNINR